MPDSLPPPPDPKRFEVSKVTLWFDRLMGWLIRLGGVAVILSVFGIFYFVIKEVVPLFQSAEVEQAGQVEIARPPAVLGVDEWGEMPFFYDGGTRLEFVDIKSGARKQLELAGLEDAKVTAYDFDEVHQRIALGLDDGRVGSVLVKYEKHFNEDASESWIVPELVMEPWFQLAAGEGPVRAVSYGDAESNRIIVGMRGEGEAATVSVLQLIMKKSLLGKGKLRLHAEVEITDQLSGAPVMVRASQNGTMVLVVNQAGDVDYFKASLEEISKRQTFHPFEGELPLQLDFLYGGVSLIVTSSEGHQHQWSLYREHEEAERLFGKVKEFPQLPAGEVVFAASMRNRSFLTGAGKMLSVRYSTSGATRWEQELDYTPVMGVIDGKSQNFIVADTEGVVRRYAIDDPHPEAGWRAFFGKVWYEGGTEAKYQWQSNGGTSDFEPKLSLVPLIFGSLKGTAYALLFSIPVALLAAVFSAAFLPLSIKRVIKPMMEIMSSIPSVVLGFLAGLWLAPILENRVPSVIVMVAAVPLVVLSFGYCWSLLPVATRSRFEGGREWMIVAPVMALAAWLGWQAGPVLESLLFVLKDPETGKVILDSAGKPVADFTRWWPQATGTPFDQRNSMVLGFIMGFAVIPVIFTIAEDALSNVPKSLTAASAALGANRWQVVWTVMLPVASSGIFSALMIGFGRAVGETMIVLMATGNTPVMDWNIFNGLRALSANIAVELPEAPEGTTHYRALFLGAVVLFVMTSVMNTLAEILRQRLKERNKIV